MFTIGICSLFVYNNSAYGKVNAVSNGTIIGKNLMGPNLGGYPNNSGIQTGGYYDKIVNPITGRKVNITSKLGKNIINNYLNLFKN